MPRYKLFSSPFLIAATLLCAAVFTMLLFIGLLNNGQFAFTLDDPYIHLALAKQLALGNYGINSGEFAAPASSILWPFLLIPATLTPLSEYLVVLINTCFALLSLWFFVRLLVLLEQSSHKKLRKSIWAFLFIVFSNQLGLIFIGMEHQLQVLLVVVIFYGMLRHQQGLAVSKTVFILLAIAPLVRFELFALTVPACLYWLLTGKSKQALASVIFQILFVGLFCGFLFLQNGQILPDSVLVKSAKLGESELGFISNFWRNLHLPKGVLLLCCSCLFFHTAWFRYINFTTRCFYFCIGLSILLHLLFGRIGWYFRYEIATWVLAGLGLFYLYTNPVLSHEGKTARKVTRGLSVLVIFLSLVEHSIAAASSPYAASNIYHQQYQMARFIQAHYAKPVAVNDLGQVSFHNETYILDLWGLASTEARKLKNQKDPSWMAQLCQQHQVGLAMIYQNAVWFPEVPTQWIKVAELQIEGPIIVSRYPVSFYATKPSEVAYIKQALSDFSLSLPAKSRLQFSQNIRAWKVIN